jgi:hypothetical protein
MAVIRQIADGPLAATAAERDSWEQDRGRAYRPIETWNDATFGPYIRATQARHDAAVSSSIRAAPPGEAVDFDIPDWNFTEFPATPEGARLFEAMQSAMAIANAPRDRLKDALRNLVAATAPPAP